MSSSLGIEPTMLAHSLDMTSVLSHKPNREAQLFKRLNVNVSTFNFGKLSPQLFRDILHYKPDHFKQLQTIYKHSQFHIVL